VTTKLPVELQEWQRLCWKISEDHGWHSEAHEQLRDEYGNVVFSNIALKLALIHSEVSEALEELRLGKIAPYYENGKPEGLVIELVDVVIRVLDVIESLGYDSQKAMEMKIRYNETRSYRHGNKLG
jgi:hypothetical protein